MANTGYQQAFESTGLFWIPGSPDKIPGQLKYTPEEGPQLSLVGGLSSNPAIDYPIIHGALNNELCTLFDCTTSSVSNSVLRQTTLKSGLTLIGDHVSSLDEAAFDGFKIRLYGLDNWVNHRAILPEFIAQQWGSSPVNFSISTQSPIISVLKDMGLTITLVGQSNGQFSTRTINCEYHSFFDVTFDSPVSILKLKNIAFELQHLLALLTWQCSPTAFFSIFRRAKDNELSSTGRKISGLYGHWPVHADKEQSSGFSFTMLSDLSTEFSDLVSSWFRLTSGIKTAKNLLTSVINSEGQYLEFTFLALMQIVEVLHKSLDSRSYMQPSDYEAVRQILVSSIPQNVEKDHRSSLKSRIQYGNELSLRTRLKELFLKLPPELQQGITDDWKKFANKAVDTRNALTHPDPDSTDQKPTSEEMQNSSLGLKLLLTIILFKELGLSFEKIGEIAAKRNWKWQLGF